MSKEMFKWIDEITKESIKEKIKELKQFQDQINFRHRLYHISRSEASCKCPEISIKNELVELQIKEMERLDRYYNG